MALKALKRINIRDLETNMLQENVAVFLDQIVVNPRLDGILIEDVQLTSGSTTTVNHGLGRKIRGWEIVYKNANADIWAADANQTLPNRQLVLSCSATAKVNLWVF